jgi:hypothetical protein
MIPLFHIDTALTFWHALRTCVRRAKANLAETCSAQIVVGLTSIGFWSATSSQPMMIDDNYSHIGTLRCVFPRAPPNLRVLEQFGHYRRIVGHSTRCISIHYTTLHALDHEKPGTTEYSVADGSSQALDTSSVSCRVVWVGETIMSCPGRYLTARRHPRSRAGLTNEPPSNSQLSSAQLSPALRPSMDGSVRFGG